MLVLTVISQYAFAATPIQVLTKEKSGIEIRITPCFEGQPTAGFAPFKIRLSNQTGQAHSWNFKFSSPGDDFRNDVNLIGYQIELGVAAGEERTFDVLVPLAVVSPTQYINQVLRIDIVGPAVVAPQQYVGSSRYGGRRRVGSVGFSGELDRTSSAELKTVIDRKQLDANNSVIDLKSLPPDWKAFSGFDAVWITAAEWDALSPAVRSAIKQWVATGGVLYRCEPGNGVATAPNPEASPWPGLMPPHGNLASHKGIHPAVSISGAALSPVVSNEALPMRSEKYGFGEIRTVSLLANGKLDAELVVAEMDRPGANGNLSSQLADQYRTSKWPDSAGVPAFQKSTLLLMGIIVLFGILVGPLNVYIFAAKEKRHRIFWTTPLLSIAGTAVVALTICVQDGFGGWGKRHALVYLLPDENAEVVVQEQASKTGVLFSNRFSLDEFTVIQPVLLSSRPTRSETDGRNYSGQWFQNRTVQGQFLAAVRPSRARVEIIMDQGTPTVVSSIGAELKELVWIDSENHFYRATDVSPGRPARLVKIDKGNSASTDGKYAGARLKYLFHQVRFTPGNFYALAATPQNVLIPTLNSIAWRDDQVVFIGPAKERPGKIQP